MAFWHCQRKYTNPPIWEDETYIRVKQDLTDIKTPTQLVDSKVELVPVEILFMIIEKLDRRTFISCLHVNKKWRSVALSVANAEKENGRWKFIHDVYLLEETYKIKSLNMSYNEIFANSLRWYIPFTFTLLKTYSVNYIKKINIYKENIIVIDCYSVKYYDVHTCKLKKSLQVDQCYDFIERDAFVLRCTQNKSDGDSDSKLLLCGKKYIDDTSFEKPVQKLQHVVHCLFDYKSIVIIGDVSQYRIEYNCCYVMKSLENILSCYTWHENHWEIANLGRFYAKRDEKVFAMSVLRCEVSLLIRWGQIMLYSYEKNNFTAVSRVRLPLHRYIFVKMVHKFCLVIGVPGDCDFRVTRMRNNEGYFCYKFECPNLTCVQEHGDMLLFGYSDGRVELFMPRAPRREDMLKRRIHISELASGPIEPDNLMVISIEVFEFVGQHYLFIATHSAVYQLLIKHDEDMCIWDFIPERPKCYRQPLARYCP